MEPFIVRAGAQQQTLEVDLTLPQLVVETDPVYIRRIVGELIHNACKYSPAGATITVVAQIVTSADEGVERKIALPALMIRVINSGVEIAAAELTRIFDKFYRIPNSDRWRHGGTGLGLALVKRLVERLGGIVQAGSGGGQTWFTVLLPIVDRNDTSR